MQASQYNWLTLEEKQLLRQRVRSNLIDWAVEALAQTGQTPAAHHRLLLTELDNLAKGRIDRLMVLMPPGSAKSTYTSILFPAWWFTQFPRTSIIAASHTYGLARYFSRRVRDLIMSNEPLLGYGISYSERAASNWRTSTGGEYYASGVRGGITGRRADLVIIDDPIKSNIEADSSGLRDGMWSWYRSDLTTRLKPGARVILIMTRWHEEDLSGQILNHEQSGWRVLSLPALAENDDPLGREGGEPIWPAWESYEELARKRNVVGSRVWAAMFQQSPRPVGGGLFKIGKLTVIDQVLPGSDERTVRAWDLAATSAASGNDPDWTVGIKLSCNSTGHYIIHDVIRLRGSPREVEEAIASTARLDGGSVWIGLPEDPGQAGKSQIAYLSGRLTGYKIMAFRETGSKFTRALPVASQIEASNFSIIRGHWNQTFISELGDFPLGRKDDQVDALVRGFITLGRVAEPARKMSISYFSR
jgi:predicted phage terminase large subunit-like protein